ncbi:MAG: PaaI family thioesterase [Chloroflexota bacterium]
MKREHLITWEDPLLSAKAARELDGVTFLQKLVDGEIAMPPISKTMGFTLTHVEKGSVTWTFEPLELHYNPIGTVHGGVLSTLMDSALGCAVHSALDAGVGYTTVQLNINLIRAVTVDTGRLTCVGTVSHLGRSMATAKSDIRDKNGKLYAESTTTCYIFQPKS